VPIFFCLIEQEAFVLKLDAENPYCAWDPFLNAENHFEKRSVGQA